MAETAVSVDLLLRLPNLRIAAVHRDTSAIPF
jgi:hypothetical protein